MKDQNKKQIEYDHMLFNLLPHLKNLESHMGGEGVAYFVDDKFVVKEYKIADDYELFDDVFDAYCTELKRFGEAGYSVPQIYSWLKIPNEDKERVARREQMPFKYYILEERKPGRWIYYSDELDEMYECCKTLCSKPEFEYAVKHKFENANLRREILKTYIGDYIAMNQTLEAMPDDELEKFVVSAYEMCEKGEYSIPDLFRKNVLVNNSEICLIDNKFEPKTDEKNDIPSSEYLLFKMVELFGTNMRTTSNPLLNGSYMRFYDDEVKNLISENRKVCTSVIMRIVDIMNKRIEMKPLKNKMLYKNISDTLRYVFGDENAKQVTSAIPTEFEK